MVYGDRDYVCNWYGGEDLSLAVNYTGTQKFAEAGYVDLKVNSSYVGGFTRQYGNFSFSRVFQAGHEVAAYQPQTAYEIFHRSMFDRDIATGEIDTAANAGYVTTGPKSVWNVENEAPPALDKMCYILWPTETCSEDQIQAINNGTAVSENYIWVGK